MNTTELKEWLLQNGGPAILLNVELSENKSRDIAKNAVSHLLGIPKVNAILNYLDEFQTQSRDKKTLEHLIHYYKETCIDNFFPKTCRIRI